MLLRLIEDGKPEIFQQQIYGFTWLLSQNSRVLLRTYLQHLDLVPGDSDSLHHFLLKVSKLAGFSKVFRLLSSRSGGGIWEDSVQFRIYPVNRKFTL